MDKTTSKSRRFQKIVKVFLANNVWSNLVHQTHPEKVRAAFEELGPTFIKIGQMLSVRTDMFSPAYIDELKKLQDEVSVDDFETVKQTITQETGLSLPDIFATFEEAPIASASIGQTHRATLKNGEEVAVKVQHANIQETIFFDLSLFEKAIPLLKTVPETNVMNLQQFFLDIKQSLAAELNFLTEAKNGKQFYEKNDHWSIIRSPWIYEEYCTSKVLVMAFVQGKSMKTFLQETKETTEQNLQKQKQFLGNLLVQHFVKQVFQDGFFHADPHPGNIYLQQIAAKEETASFRQEVALKTYRLYYLDFGMMGRLDQTLIQKLTTLMDSLYENNTKATGRAILHLCTQTGPFDEEAFFEKLEPLLDEYAGLSIGEMNLQTIFFSILTLCYQNHLQVPHEVTMLIKAIATFEGMIRSLDPSISLITVAEPFAKTYFTEKVDWSFEMKRTLLDVLYAAKTTPKLPSKLFDVLERMTTGKAKLNLEIKKQEEILNRIEGMVNRLVIGIILAALIIGSSMLVEFHEGIPGTFVSTLGVLGYSIALLAILFLIFDIWRKHKK